MPQDRLRTVSAFNPSDTEVIRRKTFAPFASSVEPEFWNLVYDKLKLHLEDGLLKEGQVVENWSDPDDAMGLKVIPIRGYFGPAPVTASCYPYRTLFFVDRTSFYDGHPVTNPERYASIGKLVLVDSRENFRKLDKNAFISKYLCPLEEAEADPAQFNSFVLLCYPDLRNYSFTYWFGFPAIAVEIGHEPAPVALKDLPFAEDFVKAFENGQEHRKSGFFAFDLKELVLKTIEQAREASMENIKYCCVDPSATPNVPGWPIRNYVASIIRQRNIASGSKLQIISVRAEKSSDLLEKSCEFTIILEFPKDWMTNPQVVGWEKAGPKVVTITD